MTSFLRASFAVTALALAPSLARADDHAPDPIDAAAARAPSTRDFGGHVPEVLLSTGLRATGVPWAGFDPYATNDLLLQFSLSAGVRFFRQGPISLSASLEWDAGGKSATTRGQDMTLFVHRLAVPLEARWQPLRRLAFFVKAAPGADRMLAASEPQLRARAWAFGVDATAGLAIMLGQVKRARFWLTGEGGYAFAFASSMKLEYQPGPDEPPRKLAATALPDLSVGGGLGRLGLGVSF